MSDKERSEIQTGLNKAVCEAAMEQWIRLTARNQYLQKNRASATFIKAFDKPEYRIYRERSVENSLRSLDKLKKGDMPEYNDWDALFYLTWYQPRQVNLVYSVLNGLEIDGTERNVLGVNNKLRIIDLGCGCLATNIAVAVAASDLAVRDYDVPEIEIDNIDINPAMILVGERIWQLFQDRMRVYRKNPIRRVLDKITHKTHIALSSLKEPSPDTHCYVTAIHCVYEQSHSWGSVNRDLERLVRQFNPIGLFLTTHSSKSDVLKKVMPNRQKGGHLYDIVYKGPIAPMFSGNAHGITDWRRSLYERCFEPNESDSPDEVDYGYIRKYLSNPVKWDCHDSELHLYIHRKMNETSPIQYTGIRDVYDDLPF